MTVQKCGVSVQFFDDEAYEAQCVLPAGHPGTVHKDPVIGDWDEDEIYTTGPS
ncbi:hypothetical protein ACFPM3_33865 [Streptomyces coeruleoprunus]|uniref:Uncharacterized protein n=1 Tax=Streptomyces coeruleoprunus TaxID=285563 RepID=A0ABV9XPR6_9ACTN